VSIAVPGVSSIARITGLAEVCEFGRERDYRYGQTGRLLVSQTTGAVQIKAGKRCGDRAILLNAHRNARARLTPQASTARAPSANLDRGISGCNSRSAAACPQSLIVVLLSGHGR
jgi:hypothetical protein